MYIVDNCVIMLMNFYMRLINHQGLVCSGIGYYVQGVVNKEQGPVFIAAFSPLAMVVTAALGAIFLAEQLYLGR